MNLWQGNTHLSRQEVYEEYWAVRGRVQTYQPRGRGRSRPSWIASPSGSSRRSATRCRSSGQPTGSHRPPRARGYGDVSRPRALVAIVVVLVPYLALLGLFVVGIAALPARRPVVLLFAFLLFYVLLHVAAHGYPRYRLPSLPVLFLVAGQGVVFLRTVPGRAPDPGDSGLRQAWAWRSRCRLARASSPGRRSRGRPSGRAWGGKSRFPRRLPRDAAQDPELP